MKEEEEEVFKNLVTIILSDTNNNNENNLRKMDNIRIMGQTLLTKCNEIEYENTAMCKVIQEELHKYRQLTFLKAKTLTTSYRNTWNELKMGKLDVSHWRSNLNTSPEVSDDECMDYGVFEDCKNNELKSWHLQQNFSNNKQPEDRTSSFIPKCYYKSPHKRVREVQINKCEYVDEPGPSSSPLQSCSPDNIKRKCYVDNSFKTDFRTGLQEYHNQNLLKNKQESVKPEELDSNPPCTSKNSNPSPTPLFSYGVTKKYLGNHRVNSKFKPVIQQQTTEASTSGTATTSSLGTTPVVEEPIDDRLKHIDPKMIELIKSEIMDHSTKVQWQEIAGLNYAKTIIKEAVILPMLRPDIFTGLRRPPRGILLFGPPGTGKTLLGKCIASQSNSTFFSISASSLTSKWIGDGEKMVRALFTVASVHQPAVVFIDEIDSLLCQRSESEHESSRRLKTEFLVQLDGVGTGEEDRILIVGATNRPQELDEAARRRLVKRLYIPLPENEARHQILVNLLKNEKHNLTLNEIDQIADKTDGYSGADIKTLCHEASMGPIRSIPFDEMKSIDIKHVRPVNVNDFLQAVTRVRASVSPNNLEQYIKWDATYGSGGIPF